MAENSAFIKNLASSDKKTRDSALSSLKLYLQNRPSIPSLDLLKLWKALFYCLWMQDKPVHQQRLSRDLASIVAILHPDTQLPFLSAFWKTMAREWTNIEALRMDKYLYLIRQVLNAGFRCLEKKGGGKWADEGALEEWNKDLMETPLSTRDAKVPNGLRYHLLDIWVDELEKVGGDADWDVEVLEKLLEPLRKLEKESVLKSIRVAAKEALEDERLKRWRGEEADEDEEMESGSENGWTEVKDGGEEESDEEWGGIED